LLRDLNDAQWTTGDFDQAMFLVGGCFQGSNIRVTDTLDSPNIAPHPATAELVDWLTRHGGSQEIRFAAQRAQTIYRDWLAKNRTKAREQIELAGNAHNYRNVYQALLNTQGWPRVRQRIESVLEGLIRRESKEEIERLRNATSEVPVDLFVFFLTATFSAVMTWWIDRRSRLTPAQIDEVYRSLVLPTIRAVLA
jgi:hypothetical protein